MKLKCLKLRRNAILMTIFGLNLICFMIISLENVKFFQLQILTEKLSPPTTLTAVPTTPTTMNPTLARKLEKIKVDLNDSQLTKESLFPGRNIGRYVMLDPYLCKRGVESLDIILIVHTAPDNLHRRQRIRETFGNESFFLPFRVRVAFLLGKTQNKTLERVLWFEHVTYNDTVMGDFLDSYYNLSIKGVMGYRWVSQYCANSKYVFKIDDDVIVNMFKLLYSFYNHMSGKRKSIFCNLWYKGTMPILRSGKWKVEPNIFAQYKTFPFDYCSGFVVIMTTDLMRPMYLAAQNTPGFWIDDVYLFGMLPHVVGGVTYYNYALNKNLTLNVQTAINCTKAEGPKCGIVASVTPDNDYWGYWNLIKNMYASESWHVDNKVVL
ncbi:beta-1 3-galactosyltransferase 1 [Biomphalaria pfeifferi]|uniref:Hexosyltransferase n=1 Tax=Biomphalaria pfeifferi TaxID=112525 RepID=A0AAD8BWH7_BIOPF|nr:beta-1 3-galactosyltransferase 1 [Biomphalaria pfeifferi]